MAYDDQEVTLKIVKNGDLYYACFVFKETQDGKIFMESNITV